MRELIKKAILIILFLVVSCSKETSVPNENIAGYIRTLDFVNSDLVLNDMNDAFGVNLEVGDGNKGGLLENVEVYVRFKEKSTDNQNSTSQEKLIKTLKKEEFSIGPDDLPRILLNITYAELVGATNANNISGGSQFLIRLKLNLSNGMSFSENEGNNSSLIGFDTFFSSPFCYTINIVDPVPDDQFVGLYSIESINDGPFGPTFNGPISFSGANYRDSTIVIELKRGNSINERFFLGYYVASRPNEPLRPFRLVFTGDGEVLFRKNQISGFFTWCPNGNINGGITSGGPPNLLGPGNEIGTSSLDDDSFFELSIAEGYQGRDGECGFGTVEVKVRLTKVE